MFLLFQGEKHFKQLDVENSCAWWKKVFKTLRCIKKHGQDIHKSLSIKNVENVG